ncbi:hypothetical protein [Methylobacterium sp. 1030]|uniref:SLOG domain-containing protein n=1 Tax=Methylobacterium sp. 1030 TaxID=3156404 RepID=UPI00339411C6
MTVVFLSASVPDPARDPAYFDSSDVIAIRDAVRALATVVLPKGRLVWGGHPAITPLIRVVAEGIGATRAESVTLYQSRFFRKDIPADNTAFERVVWTRSARGNRERSLAILRREMLASERFDAGIFVGGMEGVEAEFDLFKQMQPAAAAVPIASTGAAAARIFERNRQQFPAELETNLAYPSLFRGILGSRPGRG